MNTPTSILRFPPPFVEGDKGGGGKGDTSSVKKEEFVRADLSVFQFGYQICPISLNNAEIASSLRSSQ